VASKGVVVDTLADLLVRSRRKSGGSEKVGRLGGALELSVAGSRGRVGRLGRVELSSEAGEVGAGGDTAMN